MIRIDVSPDREFIDEIVADANSWYVTTMQDGKPVIISAEEFRARELETWLDMDDDVPTVFN